MLYLQFSLLIYNHYQVSEVVQEADSEVAAEDSEVVLEVDSEVAQQFKSTFMSMFHHQNLKNSDHNAQFQLHKPKNIIKLYSSKHQAHQPQLLQ